MSKVQPPLLPAVRRRRSTRVVIALLVILFGIPLAVFLAWRLSLANDIRALEQKIRDAGEPLTLAELAATLPPVPDEENVFTALLDLWEEEDPAYWRAIRTREGPLPERTLPVYDPDLPILGRGQGRDSYQLPWNENQLRAARAFVGTNEVRAARVRAALARPKARFPLNVEAGINVLLPHLSALKTEGGRLQIAGRFSLTQGEWNDALDHFAMDLELGSTLVDEPFAISQLVQIGHVTRFINAVEVLLLEAQAEDPPLDRLNTRLTSISLEDVFHKLLLGERAGHLALFEREITEPGLWTPGATPLTSPFNHLGLFSLDQRLMLRTYDRVSELAREGSWAGLLEADAVFKRAVEEANKFPPKFFSGLLLEGMEKLGPKIVTEEARRRCALAALAVDRFRRAHDGTLPASLEVLPGYAPECLWLDPFNNQPLRYRITPEGYRIYSLGPDQIDQQGTRRTDSDDREAYDVVFAVERPAKPQAE
jgi:hypothetical protein